MNREVRVRTAKRLLALARAITAEDSIGSEAEDVVDEQFVQKVRGLRQQLNVLAPKKNRRLKQFGIELLRPGDKVEDLVNALIKVVSAS